MQLTIEFADFTELRAKLADFLSTLVPYTGAPAVSVPAVETEPKRGRGRPPKAAAPVNEPVQTDIEDITDEPVEEVTYETVVDTLKNLNGKHGMQSVREVILKYGAQKIGELKPENYVAVIAAAKAKLAA